MHKELLKKYAVWARTELIDKITKKAVKYKKDFKNVIEDVAYTYFIRFVALRFVEVNGYLQFDFNIFDLDSYDREYSEGEYKTILISSCNELNKIMPNIFDVVPDYVEELLPDDLLKTESVIGQMITQIPVQDWKNGVEIVGWLYQYYNSSSKDLVFADLKKNIKIEKENIPTATQLFTPDWIVRYMVENSLGRLWLEGHPDNTLKSKWKYYLNESKQKKDVKIRLAKIYEDAKNKKPEDIKCIDPCMGCGHILIYMFDVLMQIYKGLGYSTIKSVQSIIENNLYGLDIDERACQLANFAIMMKARYYDNNFFRNPTIPQLYSPKNYEEGLEYGSLIIADKFEESLLSESNLNTLNFLRLLNQQYDVVVTNPPYMGRKSLNNKISKYIEKNYTYGKTELYSAFMIRCQNLTKNNGYTAMVTIHTWMFISSFKNLRKWYLENLNIVSMLHTGASTFDDLNAFNVLTTAFVTRKIYIDKYVSLFLKLNEIYNVKEKKDNFYNKNLRYYKSQDKFLTISEQPLIYWFSDKIYNLFLENKSVKDYGILINGMFTCDNNRFVKYWFEVPIEDIEFNADSNETAKKSLKKWFPYIKGGKYRKWYGNNEFVVYYKNGGQEIRDYRIERKQSKTLPGEEFYFQSGITWAPFGFENFGVRYKESGSIFDIAGSSLFVYDKKYELYILAFLASKVGFYLLSGIAPTVNFQIGNIAILPVIENKKYKDRIIELAKENIEISKKDWDNFETSWSFKRHPLLLYKEHLISRAYEKWQIETNKRYETLKANEEELNRYYIDIYNMSGEVTENVLERDISIHKSDLKSDIKGLISYAVGCMFGRYSLDKEGVISAGGKWDSDNYQIYKACENNIISIYGDKSDITSKFENFIKIAYGESYIDENLRFIADALGGKGNPREVIRNYFLKNFYADHCKMYKMKPIYKLFESGETKFLSYIHRL